MIQIAKFVFLNSHSSYPNQVFSKWCPLFADYICPLPLPKRPNIAIWNSIQLLMTIHQSASIVYMKHFSKIEISLFPSILCRKCWWATLCKIARFLNFKSAFRQMQFLQAVGFMVVTADLFLEHRLCLKSVIFSCYSFKFKISKFIINMVLFIK